jgi:hypothetical protein
MGRTTRFGVFCVLTSLAVLLLASSRGVTGLVLGVPAVVSGLVLAAGIALDRRARRAGSGGPAGNWAEELTARVRRERAEAGTVRLPADSNVGQFRLPLGATDE